MKCPHCKECPDCHGAKLVEVPGHREGCRRDPSSWDKCPTCNGKGWVCKTGRKLVENGKKKYRMFYDAPSASSCVVHAHTRLIKGRVEDDDDAIRKADEFIREMNESRTGVHVLHPEERFMLTGLAEVQEIKITTRVIRKEKLRRFRFCK